MDLISERSSEMDDEQLLKKRKNERFVYILGIFTQSLWALNGIQMKTYRTLFPECYSDHSVLFWRLFVVVVIGYCACKYKRVHIQTLSELKHLKWFICRNMTGYFFFLFWIRSYLYFRVSTISVLGGTVPLIVIIISVLLLGEKFYWRYIIGVLLCFFFFFFIILNDRKLHSKTQILKDNVFVGLLFALGNIILSSLSNVAQKVLTKEGMDVDLQSFYFGFYNCIPAFIVGIIIGEFRISNIKYVLYACSNGLIFYSANYLTTICLKYIAVSKFQPITYLSIVFTFVFCVILLGEPVFFSDIIGAAIIISFQYYNFINPPGRKIGEIHKEENNIIKENTP